MQGKDAIINKIIADAKRTEEANFEDAKAKVDEIMTNCATQCKDYVYHSKSEQDKLKDGIIRGAETVAKLDGKKLLLNAKNQLIGDTFQLALEKVRKLPKKAYEKLIFGMLKHAENGDEVIISAREKDILTEESLKEFCDKNNLKLKLSKKLGDFDGGIVLSNSGIDKNITFEIEIALLRDEMEELIAKKMFAEVK